TATATHTQEAAPKRWPRLGLVMAVAALLSGLFIAWAAGTFKVKTRDGVIVLENIPKRAEVFVDGEKITLRWPGGTGPVEVSVPPGKRGVEVKLEGFRTFGQEVMVEAGGRSPISVKLEDLVAPGPGPRSGVPTPPGTS